MNSRLFLSLVLVFTTFANTLWAGHADSERKWLVARMTAELRGHGEARADEIRAIRSAVQAMPDEEVAALADACRQLDNGNQTGTGEPPRLSPEADRLNTTLSGKSGTWVVEWHRWWIHRQATSPKANNIRGSRGSATRSAGTVTKPATDPAAPKHPSPTASKVHSPKPAKTGHTASHSAKHGK